MFSTVRFALAASIAAFAAPALASPVFDDGQEVIARVRVSDLNLANSADQLSLHKRIQDAARQVCAAITGGETMIDVDFHECYTQAFAGGWQQAEMRIAAVQSGQAFAAASPR